MNGILYFSSTGNSLYIAQKLKDSFGGQIRYIPAYTGDGSEYDRIFIVTPIYSFGLPVHVLELLPRLDKQKELIVIQNYGGMSGKLAHHRKSSVGYRQVRPLRQVRRYLSVE